MYINAVKSPVLMILFIIISLYTTAQNKKYFISPSGNDYNDGLSIESPWGTIDKVNNFPFQPGDAIHFEGGNTFIGTIKLNQSHSGKINEPLVIKSYGIGKATILGGYENGIEIINADFIEIRDLIIKGDGVYKNNGQGIRVFTERSDKMLSGIIIDNVDVSGFYWSGIAVGAATGATKGFSNLRITHSKVYENGFAGIETWGAWDDVSGKSTLNHTGLYIGYTKAFDNHGISNYTYNWSGTGILMAGVENGIIEYCEAYNNGKDNVCNTGGPVGIWLANAKSSIIQYCESYNNKAGKSKDGGGFDIDGGSQDCIIQYSYSHDNEGPGYALFEWGNNIPFTGNVIRYNISQNDARKNSYGAITFWASDASHKLLNCEVYNNSIYLSKENLVSGTPTAVKFMNQQMKGLKIRNNIFYTIEGTRMLYSANTFDTSIAHFQNNNYFDTSGKPTFYYGYNFTSFQDWKNAANGQELRGNKSYGLTKDPRFINPGGGKTINPASGGNLSYLTAYMINPGSEIIDKGINLKEEFGIEVGNFDFYQNRFTDTTKFELGANEFNASKFVVMPLRFINFSASNTNGDIKANWKVSSEKRIVRFDLEISNDGKSFDILKTIQAKPGTPVYEFNEIVKYKVSSNSYVRIKAIDELGIASYSPIAFLKADNIAAIKLYPNPAMYELFIDTNKEVYHRLTVRNMANQELIEKKINGESLHSIDVKKLVPGIYTLELQNINNNKRLNTTFIKN